MGKNTKGKKSVEKSQEQVSFERALEMQYAQEFDSLVAGFENDARVESELEAAALQSGMDVNPDIMMRYVNERPEVRVRRATFKVIKGGKD